MSPRTGRPTTDPRGKNRTGVRLTDSDMKKLEFIMGKKGESKTDIIRRGINLVYEEEIKEEKVKEKE